MKEGRKEGRREGRRERGRKKKKEAKKELENLRVFSSIGSISSSVALSFSFLNI